MTRAFPIASVQSGDRLAFLDLVRFLAALLVAFGHTRGLYFESIAKIGEPSLAVYAFYLLTSLQHEAVVVFFVVSGFLVGGTAHRSIAAGTFSPLKYLVARFARIYIVLVPAVLIAALLAYLGATWFSDTRFYSKLPLFPSGFSLAWSSRDIPCHIACVQGLKCQAFGFNPPLWSLGYEWLLYLFGPLLIGAWYLPVARAFRVVAFTVVLCFAIAIVGARNWSWAEWPAIWFLGVLAAYVRDRWPTPLWFGLAGLLLCAAALPVSRLQVLPLGATDALVAVGIAAAFTSPAVLSFALFPSLAERAAGFSYSLYLVHLPAAVFVAALLERLGWPSVLSSPGIETFSAFFIITAAVLIGAYALAAVTERQTDALRRLILRQPPV